MCYTVNWEPLSAGLVPASGLFRLHLLLYGQRRREDNAVLSSDFKEGLTTPPTFDFSPVLLYS